MGQVHGEEAVDTDLLVQGIELMMLGMGIVFGFLIILVFTLRGMSLLAGRLDKAPTSDMIAPTPIDVSHNRQLVAVISAAVERYRTPRTAKRGTETSRNRAVS